MHNPFDKSIRYENDLADFKMPYRHYGRMDLKVMQHKYQQLQNRSYGLFVRFTLGHG